MKLLRKVGATSQIFQIFIRDSSSTTGAGLTGLTNASSGLTAYYHGDTDTTATAITLVTMTVGTFTSSGFKEIDATNMPGWYQFCPPNAALDSGVSVAFHLKGATNMAPLPIEVDLDGQVDITSILGTAISTPATAGILDVNTLSVGGTTQTAGNIPAMITAVGDFIDTEITDIQGRLPAALTAGGNMKSDALALSGDTIAADNAEAFFDGTGYAGTNNVIPLVTTTTTATNLTNAPTNGDLTATMKTSVNTEVLDVLNTDTFAEPAQGTPGATISLAAKLGFLYKAWRNKTTQTATTYSLFNDDAATVDHKSTTSDDGVTFSKTEVTSGP